MFFVERNVGIRDTWTTDTLSKNELDHFIEEGFLSDPAHQSMLRPVGLEYANKIISHHIAIGHQHGEVPEANLLRVMEFLPLNDHHWKAQLLNVNAERLALSQHNEAMLTHDFITASLKRSGKWFETKSFTDPWFEMSDLVDQVVNQYSKIVEGHKITDVEEVMPAIFLKVLEPLRLQWEALFTWMALWAKSKARKNEYLWKDFLTLANCLASDRPLQEIPLMKALCETTVIASLETMDNRKTHLS